MFTDILFIIQYILVGLFVGTLIYAIVDIVKKRRRGDCSVTKALYLLHAISCMILIVGITIYSLS